ncbi:M56 family metallopeptidase [Flavobacterium sp.]|uniref:M56 family metallopeptidase n=1 Tax=Flavobacterium sp. TaxID=239 RepID=UPI004033959C
MINYLISSAISMGVLLGLYHLLLEREKMHHFNRFYLLCALVLSLIMPLIELPFPVRIIEKPVILNAVPHELMLPSVPSVVTAETTDHMPTLLWCIYGIVAFAMAIRSMVNIGRFYSIKKQGERVSYRGAALVLFKEDILPHTFLGTIYISEKDYQERLATPELLSHELAHIRQRHTLDVLFIEAVKVALWFNPLVYLYKKAIQVNHEFLADENVVRSHLNIPAYQQLLLTKALPAGIYPLASSINFSITKKRFIMMTKTTSKSKAALLQIAVLPVAATLMLFSCSTSEMNENRTVSASVNATDVTSVDKVDVESVTEDEKRELLVTEPKIFDDPSASYHKITLTENKKDGSTSTKVSYAKRSVEPDYERDQESRVAKIDPNDLVSINVYSLTEAQMDSLHDARPNKYTDTNHLNYSMMVYMLKNGEVIREIFLKKTVALK